VNTDHLAAVGLSRSLTALADRAAASKDNLGTLRIPAVHLVLDLVGSSKAAGVPVLDIDVIHAQLFGSGVSTLHEAVAIADNSGNSHAAQEAQFLIAVVHSGVTSQITSLLFFVGDQ